MTRTSWSSNATELHLSTGTGIPVLIPLKNIRQRSATQTLSEHFQPFSTIFNHFQPFSTIFNRFQPFSTIFNHFQPFSTIFNHFQPFSTIFNHFQPFSTKLARYRFMSCIRQMVSASTVADGTRSWKLLC